MTKKNCLNCQNPLTDAYCARCGQAADTHRITFKNFVFHDVLHGTFHIDRGMLFTARQSLTRPGKAALDYISGKRKKFYNVFYLILITIGLILFVGHLYEQLLISMYGKLAPEPEAVNEASKTMDALISQKKKLLIFLFVPFGALNSYLVFTRKRLNLAEHAIISGMILLGMLLIAFFGNLIFYLNVVVPFPDAIGSFYSYAVIALVLCYIGYGYYNAFSDGYSKFWIAYNIFLFFALLAFELIVMVYVAIGIITGWQMGSVSFTPFG